ncbi:MAG: dTDP-glucose 4,6-dehydratase [Phycisphaerales bacterium]|nr:dTDP-glucose 4,6-dehydratase [Phycisphaerales bacterium]
MTPPPFNKTWLVTGGAGFIGSEFLRQAHAAFPDVMLVNADALSYAASPERLASIENSPRYRFIKTNIANPTEVAAAIEACGPEGPTAIVNFAAESHVDRSLFTGVPFVMANTLGVQVLLEAAKGLIARGGAKGNFKRFLQVSTDEVYGDVEPPHRSIETDPIRTSSPYSASKAAGELLVQAFIRSFHFPAVITRCSNNYGPWHWPEKMIPLFITRLLEGKKVPVYGDGLQRRDWIHVEDHAAGILAALVNGRDGEIYNFDGDVEIDNLTLTRKLLALADRDETSIEYVKDRPGHDRRYALDSSKSKRELGWLPKWTLDAGLKQTFDWFFANKAWLSKVLDAEYQAYFRQQYDAR